MIDKLNGTRAEEIYSSFRRTRSARRYCKPPLAKNGKHLRVINRLRARRMARINADNIK